MGRVRVRVQSQMGPVCITSSWYPNFNGSHFGLPPSEIHRMTGLGGTFMRTIMYVHRPNLAPTPNTALALMQTSSIKMALGPFTFKKYASQKGGMGAIHKMAATLGDSPLRGNFSSQRSLPHLAKHFFLGFLFLLRAKKPHTNENLSGSTPLLVTMLIFAFKGLRYRIN